MNLPPLILIRDALGKAKYPIVVVLWTNRCSTPTGWSGVPHVAGRCRTVAEAYRVARNSAMKHDVMLFEWRLPAVGVRMARLLGVDVIRRRGEGARRDGKGGVA